MTIKRTKQRTVLLQSIMFLKFIHSLTFTQRRKKNEFIKILIKQDATAHACDAIAAEDEKCQHGVYAVRPDSNSDLVHQCDRCVTRRKVSQ